MSFSVLGPALAGTQDFQATASASPCAAIPSSTDSIDSLASSYSLAGAESSASKSPTPTSKPSAGKSPTPTSKPSTGKSPTPTSKPSTGKSPTPTSKPSTGKSPTPTSKPSAGKSPSGKPSPGKSASASPSPSKSPSRSPSPSPSHKTPVLCISVQPFGGSQVRPGHTATYAIFVWSTRATSKNVTVTIRLLPAADVGSPRFTVCLSGGGATCSLGDMLAGQADELKASVKVSAKAAPGEQVELTGHATATSSASGRSSAIVTVAGRAASSTNPGTRAAGETTGPAAVTLPAPAPTPPPVPLSAVPQAGTTPTNPSRLFPTITPATPGASPSFPAVAGRPRHASGHVKAATSAATLPLDPRLIGGQLAGLAILAGAIVMTIARLSLRTQRSQDGGKKAK